MNQKREDTIHQISLYKLKDVLDLSAVAINNYSRVLMEEDKTLKYALFFMLANEKQSTWFSLFSKLELDLTLFSNEPPRVKHSGFILLINVKNSTYACTGGLGFHALSGAYKLEARFGIVIAKKILLPAQLKGLVQKDSSGILNSLDRVFKKQYNPLGDIDNLHRVLTNLRATPLPSEKTIMDDDIEIGRSIRAGDSLSVSGQKNMSELLDFIKHVDRIWNRKASNKLEIHELEYINKKFEKDLVSHLFQTLEKKIIDKDNISDLFIDDQDIGLLSDKILKYTLELGRKTTALSSPEKVFQELSTLLSNGATLRQIYLSCENNEGYQDIIHRCIRDYICGDIDYEDQVYFIISGRWYRANSDFTKKVNEQINNIAYLEPDDLGLPDWKLDKGFSENKYICERCQTFTILHRHDIRPEGDKQSIELCDLLSKKDKEFFWIHIKHAKGASLRDLFSQGYVSAHLFRDNLDFRHKVINAQMDNVQETPLSSMGRKRLSELGATNSSQIHIVYAIYDDDKSHKVRNTVNMSTLDYFKKTLTLYAKIDLLRRTQDLRALGYTVVVTRIKPYS